MLSYNDLVMIVEDGVIDAPIENINGASIDVRLDSIILIERPSRYEEIRMVNLSNKESLTMDSYDISKEGFYLLHPGQFILASTIEVFNLPDNIQCSFHLKSSIARAGLNHLFAGYCDPGWNNSKLTLELKNDTQYHTHVLTPGMKIGQMEFNMVKRVPKDKSYSTVGRYNNTISATGSRGV